MKKKLTLLMLLSTVFIIAAGCTVSTSQPDGADGTLTAPIDDGIDTGDNPFGIEVDESDIDDDDDIDVVTDDDVDGDVTDTDDDDEEAEVTLPDVEIDGEEEIGAQDGVEFDELYRASGGNDDEFEWTVEGAPAWVSSEPLGSKKLVLKGTPTADAAGESFSFTVRAVDEIDSSYREMIDVTITVAEIAPSESGSGNMVSRCIQPLTIEIEKNGGWTDADANTSVDLGTKKHDVKLVAKRGDYPTLGKVTWDLKSRVKESYWCSMAKTDGFGGKVNKHEYMGNAKLIGNDAYYPASYLDQNKCAYFDDEGRWVRNESWRPKGKDVEQGSSEFSTETDDGTLKLRANFLFSGEPMPVKKFRKDKKDDLGRDPIEKLVIHAHDNCDDDGAELILNYTLVYPADKIKDVEVELEYRDAVDVSDDNWYFSLIEEECLESWCDRFSHSNISFFFLSKDPDDLFDRIEDSSGDNHDINDNATDIEPHQILMEVYPEALGHAIFRLDDLEEAEDDLEMNIKARSDESTISSITHIEMLTMAIGKSIDSSIGNTSIDIDFEGITIERMELTTDHWYVDLDNEAEDEINEWNTPGLTMGGFSLYRLYKRPMAYDFTKLMEFKRNSLNGIFSRRTWMP